MKVYIMRHGQASTGPSGESELTPFGEAQTRQVAEACLARGVTFATVFHSGKLRAHQTAKIMFEIVGGEILSRHVGLAPDDDEFEVASEIELLTKPTLFVSHLPFVDCLTGLLVEGEPRLTLVGFATAQLVCLSKNGNTWTMDWTEHP